jgi:hypothetical protein
MDALPQEVRQEVVMRAAQIDGQLLTAYRFHSGESSERLRASVHRHFRDAGRHVIELTRGEWQIVSARGQDGLDSVQMRATAAGTEGTATQWRWRAGVLGAGAMAGQGAATAASSAAIDANPVMNWLPTGARIVRQMAHDDPVRMAATVVALVNDPPDAAAHHLRQRARAAGFQSDPTLGMPAQQAAWYRGGSPASGGATGEALALRRNAEEVIATVSRHRDSTAVVMHWSRPQ